MEYNERVLNRRDLDGLWWQQDAASSHRANETMQMLRQFFGDRVIALGTSPLFWAARFCDGQPCDTWLWPRTKDKVYEHGPVLNREQLYDAINAVYDFLPIEEFVAAT